MKYCQSCGSQHDENARFCSRCGGNFENNQPPVYNQVDPNSYQGQTTQNSYYAQPNQSKPILSQNPVLNKVKGLATTPLFLVSIIIYTVLVFTRLVTVIASMPLMRTIFRNNYNYHLNSFVRTDLFVPMMSIMQRVFIVYSVLAFIPCILICIGLWMFYSSSSTYENRSTSGLTLIKISTIINLVTIVAIPLIIIFVFMISGANREFPIRGLFVYLIIISVVYVLPVMYYFSIFKTIDQIRGTIITGIPTDKISVFLVVMNYIVAGIGIISILFTRSSVLVTLLNAAFLITISIGLYEYKKEMMKLIYQPQYANNVGYRSGV